MTMTEDELMRGITDALTLAGWTWMHIIRSDGVTAGGEGFPDIVAYHPLRHLVILWELKGERTPITAAQASWIANTAGLPIDSAIVRPVDYDAALDMILGRVDHRLAMLREQERETTRAGDDDPAQAWPGNLSH